MKLSFTLALLLASISSSLYAQVPPCPSGTLANVLGTSCTIGNLTFNFQNNFHGFAQNTDIATNTLTTTFFGPEAIGFAPVSSGNQTGFLLATNFVDNANGSGLFFSSHAANFSYSVQVNGAFEILGESSSIVGTVTQVDIDDISAFDHQCFPDGECLTVAPTVNFTPFTGFFNNPSDNATLAFPALSSTGLSGLPFTTAVNSFAFQGDTATLNSASFLFAIASQIPPPPPANLQYQNIDLPGVQTTSVAAINDHGQTAGFVQDFSGLLHGYATDRDGDPTLIDFPGADLTVVNGINNQGDVVGQYVDDEGVVHGFLLTGGSFSTLDFPGSIFNAAEGINDHGQIAGFYQDTDFNVHGYLFDQGNFTNIDDPNAFIVFDPSMPPLAITEIFSLNDRTNMAGFYLDLNNFGHSFLLSSGLFSTIQVPAGLAGTFAAGLNDPGEVVGFFTDVSFTSHGFLVSDSGLETVDFPGATGTFPKQINSPGHIAGTYNDSAGALHSFLAEKAASNGNPGGASQPAVAQENSATRPAAQPRPCIGKQTVSPDRKTGRLSCATK